MAAPHKELMSQSMTKLALPLPLTSYQDEEDKIKQQSQFLHSSRTERNDKKLRCRPSVLASSQRSYRLMAAERNNLASNSPTLKSSINTMGQLINSRPN